MRPEPAGACTPPATSIPQAEGDGFRHRRMLTPRLRPAGFDELGLRRALADRVLPFLVAAMALLAALALAGWVGAASLARHWQEGAGAALTVQVPQPGEPAAQGGGTRVERVLALLTGSPGIAAARALSTKELDTLLHPWLGAAAERLAVPLPAVIAVRLSQSDVDLRPLAARLEAAAPGTLTESHDIWISRLARLSHSLQACAGLALLLVVAVAAAVIAVATRAGLAARREAIEIVHGLGATDGYIAARFAGRATLLALAGGTAGAVLALPVLLTLAIMAAPFAGTAAMPDGPAEALAALPTSLWLALPGLPAVAAAIGFITAHGTVRWWLRRLP